MYFAFYEPNGMQSKCRIFYFTIFHDSIIIRTSQDGTVFN